MYNKSPRRLRVEKKQREQQRLQQKKALENLTQLFKDKNAKIMHMQRIEQNKSFQKEFDMMKRLLKNDKAIKPFQKPIMPKTDSDEFKIFKKGKEFMRL